MLLNPPSRRLNRVLDSLWYVAGAPQTLVVLLALVAATLALAAIFPQLPPGLDTAAADRWFSTATARFAGLMPLLQSVGAFEILSGPWLTFLLAALGLNLALRLAMQARYLWRRPAAGRTPLPPAGLSPAYATVQADLNNMAKSTEGALAQRFGPPIAGADGPCLQLYAERRRVGAWGAGLGYLGGLLLITGLLVDATLGWRAAGVTVAQGEPATLSQAGGLRVVLDSLEAGGDDPAADLSLLAEGQSHSVRVSTTRPGRWGSLLVAARATGPALAIRAHDRNSQPLLLQALDGGGEVGDTLRLLFDQTQSERAFAIPTRDLTFRVIYYSSLPDQDRTQPVYQVEAYRGAESAPVTSVLVEDVAQLEVQGVGLSFSDERYVDVEAAYLPGLAPWLLGSLLILLGVLLSTCLPARQAWVDLGPVKEGVRTVVRVAGPVLPAAEAARLLERLTGSDPIPSGESSADRDRPEDDVRPGDGGHPEDGDHPQDGHHSRDRKHPTDAESHGDADSAANTASATGGERAGHAER